jgi:hypothetical protein
MGPPVSVKETNTSSGSNNKYFWGSRGGQRAEEDLAEEDLAKEGRPAEGGGGPAGAKGGRTANRRIVGVGPARSSR